MARPTVRQRAKELGLAHRIAETNADAVKDADLVIACVPVGACGPIAKEIAAHLKAGAIVSDVGSVKTAVLKDMSAHLPATVDFIPAHPVAGTEHSGPRRGLRRTVRQSLVHPDARRKRHRPAAVERLKAFWQALGANVETMTAEHHDLVLAITSHLPHLIAYTIVGTAEELEGVTESEVLKFSAGGFRDFTRIAASDPTMWRDVFLNNKDAVLEMLGEFQEDLSKLTRAIRRGDGDALFEHFTAHPRDPPRHPEHRPGRRKRRLRPPASGPAAEDRRQDARTAAASARRGSGRDTPRRPQSAAETPAPDVPSSVVFCPSMPTMPPSATGAFCRTTLPRPGISLSSAPMALSTCSAFSPGAKPIECRLRHALFENLVETERRHDLVHPGHDHLQLALEHPLRREPERS